MTVGHEAGGYFPPAFLYALSAERFAENHIIQMLTASRHVLFFDVILSAASQFCLLVCYNVNKTHIL
ncbi:MAG TPA: hypothetical protein DIT05_11115 [Morganella sp. (in: Bacteria)]|nr:hypothetical protein [Morganella sp. (in: enterobacteria)]